MQTHLTPTHLFRALSIAGIASLIALAPAALAQVSPPTPQSVAPGYTPPASEMTSQPYYAYVPTRAGTWDFYLNIGYAFYGDSSHNNTSIYNPFANSGAGGYANGNMKFKLDDDFTFGFGFDYNINDRLAVGAEFSYSQPSYDASFEITSGPGAGTTLRISGDADIYTGDAFIQYNFTNKSKLTPFVRASVGFAWIDTGIPSGPTEYYWWWDWWWGGYYLVGDTPTESDTYLTLGATAGLRYDFGNHVYMTASYNASWVDTSHDWVTNQRVSLSVGWSY